MKYELTLTVRSEQNQSFTPDQFDRIIADGLVSLLSQLIVLIASLHRRELEEHGKSNEDDIPF
jgi:hypothetical protein